MKILRYILFLLLLQKGIQAQESTGNACCLSTYFELLEKHPHLKQTGNHRLDEIEIVLNPKTIAEIIEKEYQRLIKLDIEPEIAKRWSYPGIMYTDPYLFVIRDPVIFPNGKTGLFKRVIWKCTLNQEKPVAVLPVDSNGKICLIKIWRHAIGSWELEIPRGAPNNRETPVENALRELREETGFVADRIINLGSVNPDSGVLATHLDVFVAFSSHEGSFEPDENEVISGIYFFSIPELEEGIKKGFLEVSEKGRVLKVPLRDPFLTFALFQARLRAVL